MDRDLQRPNTYESFIEGFSDIRVRINETGNFTLQPGHNTNRRVLMRCVWMGWDIETGIATDLHFQLVEQHGPKIGLYSVNPLTGELSTESFDGQPSIGDTIDLAQKGIAAVLSYRELPPVYQGRTMNIVHDMSDLTSTQGRLSSSENATGYLLANSEMSASERLVFFQAMLGDLSLRSLD
jgi:hypothetical protein